MKENEIADLKCASSPAPKVSVTVLTFNHGQWLAECLESIVTQETNFPFEIIVGDDASTDGVTPQILRDYSNRYPHLIIPVLREKNINGTQNYLDVMRRARGEYIAFIDGDDMMLPGKLQKQADFLDRNTDCTIVAHNVRKIQGGTGKVISESFVNFTVPEKADINYLCQKGSYFAHCSKMYRRSAIISRYRERRTIDLFYHIEQASKGNIGYINETLGVYRRSPLTASDPRGAFGRILEQANEDAYRRAEELGVDPEIIKHLEVNWKCDRALQFLRCGDVETFRQMIGVISVNKRYASFRNKVVIRLRAFPFVAKAILSVRDILVMAYPELKASVRNSLRKMKTTRPNPGPDGD
ncbi:MAG: glycosyltransferase family 2 protein [Actinomycetota bacterium]|nr:glycosyltransferase family 2 protein [Actinomycetota bacterium]